MVTVEEGEHVGVFFVGVEGISGREIVFVLIKGGRAGVV